VPDTKPLVSGDELHLWFVALDVDGRVLDELDRELSADERETAGRFVYPRDRRRSTVARASLRRVLAGYLDVAPADVPLTRAESGKPELREAAGVHFNLSHSGETAVIAVAHSPVGVDAERVRPDLSPADLARTALTERERSLLADLPEGDRRRVFFEVWTLKEAYVKATGAGIGAFETFDVWPGRSVHDGLRPAAVGPEGWYLANVEPADELVVAVALQHAPARVRRSEVA